MLSVKARLSVKVLVWKIFHILMQIKFGKILHLPSFWKWEFLYRIFHLALTNEIRRLQISSPWSCGRHIEKRGNPGHDVAHMYHGGLWIINIEGVIISLFLHFSGTFFGYRCQKWSATMLQWETVQKFKRYGCIFAFDTPWNLKLFDAIWS